MSNRSYVRMTYTERLTLEKLYNAGDTIRAVASRLGRAPSTVSCEIRRGLYDALDGSTWKTVRRYSAAIAQEDADFQASSKGRMIKLGKRYDYAQVIADRIRSGEAPDAIVGDLRNKGIWTVSTSTLYRYIDLGYIPGVTNDDLIGKPKRKRPYRHVRKAARPPKGVSIEKRPDDINDRSVPGHWEMDTVIGRSSGRGEALLVLTERLTRFEIVWKLPDKTAVSVTTALRRIVGLYPPGTFLTLTVDNGPENQDYETMRQLVGEVYYCHPYRSCERGSNENKNILVRRFFPKGVSMADRTQADADFAATFLNNMHLRVLGYFTPQELFDVWQEALVCAPGP